MPRYNSVCSRAVLDLCVITFCALLAGLFVFFVFFSILLDAECYFKIGNFKIHLHVNCLIGFLSLTWKPGKIYPFRYLEVLSTHSHTCTSEELHHTPPTRTQFYTSSTSLLDHNQATKVRLNGRAAPTVGKRALTFRNTCCAEYSSQPLASRFFSLTSPT